MVSGNCRAEFSAPAHARVRTATRAARDDTAKTVAAPLPTQPSPAVLSALRTLVSATLRVGLHRTQQDPAIAQSLLSSFEQASAPVVRAFLDELRNTAIDEERRREVAIQAAWDVAFLQQIWRVEGATEGEATDWLKVRAKFLAIVSHSCNPNHEETFR